MKEAEHDWLCGIIGLTFDWKVAGSKSGEQKALRQVKNDYFEGELTETEGHPHLTPSGLELADNPAQHQNFILHHKERSCMAKIGLSRRKHMPVLKLYGATFPLWDYRKVKAIEKTGLKLDIWGFAL